MAESDDDFVARWSRRKRKTRTAAATPPPASQVEAARGAPPKAAETQGSPKNPENTEAEAPELPDPDTLDADADYTVFLKDNVPEAIRQRALRRLWRSDPVLANLDGLIDYGGDFTDAATVVKGLKTLYQVGRGFVLEEDEKPAPAAAAEESEAPTETEPAEEHAAAQAAPEPQPAAVPPPRAETRQRAAGAPEVRRRGALERRWGDAGNPRKRGSD